ncbi:MAG: UDP-N-acetylmuramoyl-tripeptide--D-alanyl-D-alanine ligase [Deltaproteobacteria bacterium]|nr:UDP-N-acetylmuramoyl-tripeptide--D-alanyl-D-alanine ligase [Deltaproteobacteria bacterium]
MRFDVTEIAKAVGGTVMRGPKDAIVTGVATDSRKAASGEIFFALKGPSFDGHAFVGEVASKGVSAAVVERTEGLGELPASFTLIEVKETLEALGALALYVRGLSRIPFVAVSGSAGKTTTKEMIASILSVSRNVLKTEGNKNNLIGLPLTIFNLTPAHEAAVVELGISETWEMERLVNICRPDVALLTNIGRGHLKTLGSLEGVAKAKGALFTLLPFHAVRIVNLDDQWVVKLSEGFENTVTYSLKEKADVTVLAHKQDPDFGGIEAVYGVRGKDLQVRFSTPGATNIINGAAAIAAALSLGTALDDMRKGLENFRPVKGRMHVLKVDGFTVLDDTYNANPESMSSALKTLAAARGRKVAVLGDMLELGAVTDAEHERVGRLAGELKVDFVVAIGANSGVLADGARKAGVKSVLSFKDRSEALGALKGLVREGDTVLVKGSRGVALEAIVDGLKELGLKKACC